MATDRKKNCWEHMHCGREPGGENVLELGVCPATVDMRFDGVNGGDYAGRFCWIIAGTFCDGDVQGTFAQKLRNCLECTFFLEVAKQEGKDMLFLLEDYFRGVRS